MYRTPKPKNYPFVHTFHPIVDEYPQLRTPLYGPDVLPAQFSRQFVYDTKGDIMYTLPLNAYPGSKIL